MVRKSLVLPSKIRVDRGTETGITATTRGQHADLNDPTEELISGDSFNLILIKFSGASKHDENIYQGT